MDFLKRYPILTTFLAICMVSFGVEAFFLVRYRSAAVTAQKNLSRSESDMKSASVLTPAPIQKNRDAAKENADALEAHLKLVIDSLQSNTQPMPPPPPDGPSLLSAIQGYVDTFRTKAKEKGIELATPDFTFGMGQYVGSLPPSADKIPVVFKQMVILQYILTHLMDEAKLDKQRLVLLSVERENVAVAAKADSAAPAASYDIKEAAETFTMSPMVSAKVPGAVDTLAFRIKFIGYTDELRPLINVLAKFELPLVVRSIEVEPPASEVLSAVASANKAPIVAGASGVSFGSGSGKIAATPQNLDPVVKDNLSQFTIIIEFISLQLPKDGTTPAAPATPAATTAPAAAGAPATH